MLSNKPNTRSCLTCRESIRGRSDKKFCDDTCRNTYNNHRNQTRDPYIKQINKVLKNNRNILARLFEQNQHLVSMEELYMYGYSFSFFTHIKNSDEDDMYQFCYDFGIKATSEDVLQIISWRQIGISTHATNS